MIIGSDNFCIEPTFCYMLSTVIRHLSASAISRCCWYGFKYVGRLYGQFKHTALQQATYLGTVHKILFNLVVLLAMLIRRHSKECSIHLNMVYDYHWMIFALRSYSPKIWTRFGISLNQKPFFICSVKTCSYSEPF